MNLKHRLLRKAIRDIINETRGTRGTRGGVAVPGDPNPHSRKVFFPGHDDEYPVIRKGFDDDFIEIPDYLKAADLRDYENWYIDNIGYVDDEGSVWGNTKYRGFFDYDTGRFYPGKQNTKTGEDGDSIDDSMEDLGRSEDEFFMVIESQVTRGKGGVILHPASNGSFSVQEDKSSGTLAGDLYWSWQKATGKTAHDRATEVIETLMKHDIVQESVIDDKLIEEYGVRGRDSNKVYGILEYFGEYNNGVIKEAKKRARLLKRRRRSKL